MRTKVKKLFNGHASVRDTIVLRAINKDEPLEIEYQNKIMTVSVIELYKAKGKFHIINFKSKFNYNITYRLIDFPFIPDYLKEEYKNGK
jgi:hypothetical protein